MEKITMLRLEKIFAWVTFVSGVFLVVAEMAIAVSHGSLSEMDTWELMLGAFFCWVLLAMGCTLQGRAGKS